MADLFLNTKKMKIFKELNKIGYKHYTENTIEELDNLPLDSEERIIEQSLAFRWFREHQEWPIESWIRPFISQQPRSYSAMIWTRGQIIHAGVFSTHNEAQLGLLRKLIEIVKNK